MDWNNGGTYEVVHECGTLYKDRRVVRPLNLADIGAVVINVGTVVHSPGLIVYEADAGQPVPGFLGLVGERRIAGEPGETGSHVEEASIRKGWETCKQWHTPLN